MKLSQSHEYERVLGNKYFYNFSFKIVKKGMEELLVYKSIYSSDFVLKESLPTIIHIKITFSKLKSVEYFEFDR